MQAARRAASWHRGNAHSRRPHATAHNRACAGGQAGKRSQLHCHPCDLKQLGGWDATRAGNCRTTVQDARRAVKPTTVGTQVAVAEDDMWLAIKYGCGARWGLRVVFDVSLQPAGSDRPRLHPSPKTTCAATSNSAVSSSRCAALERHRGARWRGANKRIHLAR